MNRTIRAIIGVIFVLVITFSAINICQNVGRSLQIDITDQRIYSLSKGTRAILARLNQPVNVKLYYAEKAALKAPDQIRYFNNYYEFVKALLREYVAESKGMVELEIIDPEPFSEQEVEALQYGLRRFAITQEENFFFGLVVQTQFGVEKVIPFFSPNRQNFVEYDITQLIDAAITRQKTRLGIMSSLPVMGEDLSGYMAQMKRMQGQQPEGPWIVVEQLRSKYEVTKVPIDVNDVNDINDIDILLVVHPKNLPERTLFAIDQFVLKGGRTIVCLDPHCVVDRPDRMQMQMGRQPTQNSNVAPLLSTWGLEMPDNTFAGDRILALKAPLGREPRPQTIIGLLGLVPELTEQFKPQGWRGCYNTDNVITASLNQVRVLFAGVLREAVDSNEPAEPGEAGVAQVERTPLLKTTNTGNSWKVSGPYELMFPDAERLMSKFIEGDKPVVMGYLLTGRFKSSFPDGIEVEVESTEDSEASSDEAEDPNKPKKTKKRMEGLKQAAEDCAVVVFSDVDFISDMLAYQPTFFGNVVAGDNSALLLNAIDDLAGSSDLISIRSRGNFQRPFLVVDEIEQQAEQETAEEVAKLNAEIAGFTKELQSILASAKEEEAEVVGSSIVKKQREIELKKREAQRQLRQVKMTRRERIEHLGNTLRNFNVVLIPAIVLAVAVVFAVHRSARARGYWIELAKIGELPRLPKTFGSVRFSIALLALLHIVTGGIFTLIWFGVLHGKLPKVRRNDPSAAKAILFCLIPLFNIYWAFFFWYRLCARVDEQRVKYSLQEKSLLGLAAVFLVSAVSASIINLIHSGFGLRLPHSIAVTLSVAIFASSLVIGVLGLVFACLMQLRVNEIVEVSTPKARRS